MVRLIVFLVTLVDDLGVARSVAAGAAALLSTFTGVLSSAGAVAEVAAGAASIDVGCVCCASCAKRLVEDSAKTAAIAVAQARA